MSKSILAGIEQHTRIHEGLVPALILTLLLLSLFLSPAFAQASPQIWTTNVVPGEFPSRQSALAAVRARGGIYALAEREEDVYQTAQGTAYWYGANPRNPLIGEWGNYTVVGAGGPFSSEQEAMQAAMNWWLRQQGGGNYCQAPAVRIRTGWGQWRRWYDGTAYEESAIFETTWGEPDFPSQGDCYVVTRGSQAWRSRPISCPANTTWYHTDQACVAKHIALIASKPILDCSVSSPGSLVHNPCNVATGGKYQRELDIDLPWIKLSRHYHSSHSAPRAALGQGWTHDLNVRLYLHGGQGAGLLLPSGNVLPFRGQNESVDGAGWRIVSVNIGSVRYEVHNANEIYSFSSSGRLLRLDRSDGSSITPDYDTLGRLVSAKHSSGRSLEFLYESTSPAIAARIASILSDGVPLVSYGYDDSDRLVSADYPEGSRTYHYEDANYPNHLTGISDESGERFSLYQYNDDGLLIVSEHAGGVYRGTFDYLSNGSTTYTDPNLSTKTYSFTSDGMYRKITAIQDASGTLGVTYPSSSQDFRRRPTSTTSAGGTVTSFSYSEMVDQEIGKNVRVVVRTEAVNTSDQRIIETRTDPANGRVLKTVENGSRDTTFTYNSRGQVSTRSERDLASASTRSTAFSYCEQAGVDIGSCPMVGLVMSVDGPRTDVNDVTTYAYRMADAPGCDTSPATCEYRKGDLWKVTNALGQVTETLRYDHAGRALSAKDPNGVVTDYEYHPRGWLTARKVRGTNDASETDDRITTVEYWPTGLVKQVTQPDGAFLAYGYDAAQRLTTITDNAGNTITYTLDNTGNRVQEDTRDQSGTLRRTFSRVYNQLGQLATQADASLNPTDFSYDANGNLETTTDPLGRVTANDYDPLNRLIRTLQDIDGIEAETTFEYDALDNLTRVTDPKGLETTYTYDSAGNRTSQTDANQVTTTYSYDALNRLVGVGYPDANRNLTYLYDTAINVCPADANFQQGRLGRLRDASGSTILRYCYDRFGNMTRKHQVTDGKHHIVHYGYTKSGQLASITYPDGAVVDYVRDAQGRVMQVGATPISRSREILLDQVQHYPFGPVAGWRYGTGSRQMVREYDLDYRPVSIRTLGPGGLDLGYRYDPAGNLASLHTADLAEPPRARFDHDALGRLTAFRDGPTDVAIESYVYDATGNRTSFANAGGSQSYAYPTDSHRLASVAGVSRTYDAVGNTLTIGSGKEYVYGHANRLTQVKQGGVVTMKYAYNGTGERVRRYIGTDNTYSTYDEAGRWIGDYRSSPATEASQRIIWLDDLPVAVLWSRVDTEVVGPDPDPGPGDPDPPIYSRSAGSSPAIVVDELYYIEPDHLGTPRAVIDPVRDVAVWSWDLRNEAFGNSPPDQDADGDGTSFVFDMRFPGQRYDAASGLNYNYFREYEPGTGRYSQSDPIGLGGGMSTYAFVDGQPTLLIDPYGLEWVNPWNIYQRFRRGDGSSMAERRRDYRQDQLNNMGAGVSPAQALDHLVPAGQLICMQVMCYVSSDSMYCRVGEGWVERTYLPYPPTVAQVNRTPGCICERSRSINSSGPPQADAFDSMEVIQRMLRNRNRGK